MGGDTDSCILQRLQSDVTPGPLHLRLVLSMSPPAQVHPMFCLSIEMSFCTPCRNPTRVSRRITQEDLLGIRDYNIASAGGRQLDEYG